MKQFFTILIFILSALGTQSLHAADSSVSDKNIFTNAIEEDEFLSPDVAFKLAITQKNATQLIANFKVEPGYYLYKQRIKFSFVDANAGRVTSIDLPAGEEKNDPNFGKQAVYHHDFNAMINLAIADKPNSNSMIKAVYQGCSEKGLCYAPITKLIDLKSLQSNTNTNNTENNVSSKSVVFNANAADDDKTTLALKTGNLWLVIGGFFVAGLLLSFTPCVLPMIPILSSIIVGSQSKQLKPNKLQAFSLSVAYVLGMALSYTLAGVAAGLSGNLLSQSLQSPLVLGLTALLFVVLAFSMFGFYELKLPAFLENKILGTSQNLKGGKFFGVFMMGVLSALIVSPCVAAPLAGALIYIGQTHNVLLGGAGLFALALGMGVPLLLIGASAGSLLPKTGGWMTKVRNLFGVLMIIMAAYIAWPVLPQMVTQPINNMLGLSAAHTLPFTRVKTVAQLDAAIANANGKMVMLDFYADWCVACKEMEKLTFSDAKVKAALANAVLLQADVTANNDDDQALLKRFNLFGPPGIIFYDKTGKQLATRVIGYKNTDDFIQILYKVNAK